MTPALVALAVAACGFGAVARHGINQLGAQSRWPWPTLVANVLGSGVMGVAAAAVLVSHAPIGWLLVFGGGFAGGLSTVSTLAIDALVLWHDGQRRSAAAYVIVTLATGLGSAAAGWAIAAQAWG